MAKDKPVLAGSILTVQDIQAWYEDNPLPPSKAELSFPMVENRKGSTWKTISNYATVQNEAADPISLNSTVPVAGRQGYKNVLGDMTSFGKGREWNADEIEEYEQLKIKFAEVGNKQAAEQLLNYYGDDLAFVRKAMEAEKSYLCWALVSNACSIELAAANSPYLQGLAAFNYSVSSWQKDAVDTSWANTASLILDDIEDVLDLGDTYGKTYNTIFINQTWWKYIRKNAQIQAQCISLVASLVEAKTLPTLDAINSMMEEYFGYGVRFVIIDEKVTRSAISDTKTTAIPFQDGVAVFSQSSTLGHFEWNGIPIIDPSRETRESFFTVGNLLSVDPSYSKIYAKGRAFPVVDTYADNVYLKVNAVSW